MAAKLLDALAFSGLWIAAAAAALCGVAGLAMGVGILWPALAVAACGTLVVYDVDRLRDLQRDRLTAPARSAFVARHTRALRALCVAAGAGAIGLAPGLGARPVVLLACVLALGLAHRRLKDVPFAKAAYVSAAWLAVVVGVPALAAAGERHVGWIAATLGLALFANAVASSIRDAEAAAARFGGVRTLAAARAFAMAGVAAGALAPGAVRPLAAVPLVTLMALARFRPTERYGLLVVDGALLAGAGLALLSL